MTSGAASTHPKRQSQASHPRKAVPNNPLGVAVLVLGNGTYGIHGTNRPEKIGTSTSYGIFRMYNSDNLALFNQVRIGAVVYVQR